MKPLPRLKELLPELQRYVEHQAERAEVTYKAECQVCHKLSPILWSGVCEGCFADWAIGSRLPGTRIPVGAEYPFGSPIPFYTLYGGWIWRIPPTTPSEVVYSLLHRKKFPPAIPQDWVLIDVHLGTFYKAKELYRFLPKTPGTYAIAVVQKDRILDYAVERVDRGRQEPEPQPKKSKQEEALEKLIPYTVIHRHSDGDLTVMSQGIRYVLTTEGKVFREV